MPRRPNSNQDNLEALIEILDSQGWVVAASEMSRSIKKVRERILTGGSSNVEADIQALRTLKQMFNDLYAFAALDVPQELQALFN